MKRNQQRLHNVLSYSFAVFSVFYLSIRLAASAVWCSGAMEKFQSASNHILNCRTIDDGQMENFGNQVLELEQESRDIRSSTDSAVSETTTSSYVSSSSADDLANTRYGTTCKGFLTVLSNRDTSESYLRGRSLYKSDMAPRVSLQVRRLK